MSSQNPGRSLKVFLCHGSEDKPAVRRLHEALTRDGFSPWMDEKDLLPGQDWEYEIRRTVRQVDVFLVCLSASSASRKGFAQKEIRIALDEAELLPAGEIYIIPARLESFELPERLSQWHFVDLFESDGYAKLLRALRLKNKRPGHATAPAPALGPSAGPAPEPLPFEASSPAASTPVGTPASPNSSQKMSENKIGLIAAVIGALAGVVGAIAAVISLFPQDAASDLTPRTVINRPATGDVDSSPAGDVDSSPAEVPDSPTKTDVPDDSANEQTPTDQKAGPPMDPSASPTSGETAPRSENKTPGPDSCDGRPITLIDGASCFSEEASLGIAVRFSFIAGKNRPSLTISPKNAPQVVRGFIGPGEIDLTSAEDSWRVSVIGIDATSKFVTLNLSRIDR